MDGSYVIGTLNLYDPQTTAGELVPPSLGTGNAITGSADAVDIRDTWTEFGAIEADCVIVTTDVDPSGVITHRAEQTGPSQCPVFAATINVSSTAFAGCSLTLVGNSFPADVSGDITPEGVVTLRTPRIPPRGPCLWHSRFSCLLAANVLF